MKVISKESPIQIDSLPCYEADISGAKASAIIYSIAEIAKENNLKPYEYFECLPSIIPEHMENTDTSFLEELIPWPESLPENIRKPKQ